MKIAALLIAVALVCILYTRQQKVVAASEQAAAKDAGVVLADQPGASAGAPAVHSVYKRALDTTHSTVEQVRVQQAERASEDQF